MAKKKQKQSAQELQFLKELVALSESLFDGRYKEAFDSPPRSLGMTRNPAKAAQEKLQSGQRQGSDEDETWIEQQYRTGEILIPDWEPDLLFSIYDESDVLKRGIRVLLNNIDRAHQWRYVGPKADKDKEEPQGRKQRLEKFFSRINEKHSWLTLRRKVREDRKVTGNGFVEVLRDPTDGQLKRMYHMPCKYVRITKLDDEPTKVWVPVPREGAENGIEWQLVYKRFRRFARYYYQDKKPEWYKELGDPRVLNKQSGQYAKDSEGNYLREWDWDGEKRTWTNQGHPDRANELWWFRDISGGNPYGAPDWCSAMQDVRGRYLAGWVNYDTLDHGGMPPWLLLIYGQLTKGSREYLTKLMAKWRDPSSFSDPGVLEIEPSLLSWNTSGGQKAGAEFVSMRDMRSEEAMFSKYRRETLEVISAILGVPLVLMGYTDGQGEASYAAMEAAENQTFEPERSAFDERTNVEIIEAEFGIYDWRISTKAAPIGDNEQKYKAMGVAGRQGGPSMNELLEIENELFGTQWEKRDGWFYSDIGAAEATALVRNGLVSYDPPTKQWFMIGQRPVQQSESKSKKSTPNPLNDKEPNPVTAEKSDEPLDQEALMLMSSLLRARKETQKYEPGNCDHDFKM